MAVFFFLSFFFIYFLFSLFFSGGWVGGWAEVISCFPTHPLSQPVLRQKIPVTARRAIIMVLYPMACLHNTARGLNYLFKTKNKNKKDTKEKRKRFFFFLTTLRLIFCMTFTYSPNIYTPTQDTLTGLTQIKVRIHWFSFSSPPPSHPFFFLFFLFFFLS